MAPTQTSHQQQPPIIIVPHAVIDLICSTPSQTQIPKISVSTIQWSGAVCVFQKCIYFLFERSPCPFRETDSSAFPIPIIVFFFAIPPITTYFFRSSTYLNWIKLKTREIVFSATEEF